MTYRNHYCKTCDRHWAAVPLYTTQTVNANGEYTQFCKCGRVPTETSEAFSGPIPDKAVHTEGAIPPMPSRSSIPSRSPKSPIPVNSKLPTKKTGQSELHSQARLPITVEGKIDALASKHDHDSMFELLVVGGMGGGIEGDGEGGIPAIVEPECPRLFQENGKWYLQVNDLFSEPDEKDFTRTFEIGLHETNDDQIVFKEV